MHQNKRSSWRKWPAVAGLLASIFIIYGLTLVSRSHRLQSSIEQQIGLLDELDLIAADLQGLAAIHSTDLHSDRFQWPQQLKRLREQIDRVAIARTDLPGMASFKPDLDQLIHRADSVHRMAMAEEAGSTEQHDHTAILQILLQQGRKVMDRSVHALHKDGLAGNSRALSASWNEAQILVITACMLAA